jgi:hypothetical protein
MAWCRCNCSHEKYGGSNAGLSQSRFVTKQVQDDMTNECRCFMTYSGLKLSLKLSQPLVEPVLNDRNTFLRAWF